MSSVAMKYEDWIRGCVHHDGRKGNVYLPCDKVLEIADWIEAHRDVAPVRHGRWEVVDAEEPRRFGCSICGRLSWYMDNYCPNCGARMNTCKHYDDDWCSGACDSCERNPSYWERKDDE